MDVRLKRAQVAPARNDGYRVLVDRIWPRGIPRDDLRADLWMKDVAPSEELRRWFDHEVEKWPEFRRRYLEELREKGDALDELVERLRRGRRVTLVFGARDTNHNNAVVLKEYLQRAAIS